MSQNVSENFMGQLLAAAVRAAGGRVQFTELELHSGSNLSIEFDPPADRVARPERTITITVTALEDQD